jgi:internalin A
MTTPPPKRRRWFQFRLRTLLIALLVLSLPLSWFAVELQRVRRQRQAVEAIKQLGGFVDEREKTSVPKWIRESFPEDFFTEVVEVRLLDNKHRNAMVKVLNAVSTDNEIEKLPPHVADPGFEHLKELTSLRKLTLRNTTATGTDLEHLAELTNLQELDLRDTDVTDAGLEHLRALSNLAWLNLDRTKITDAGLQHLEGLTNLAFLSLQKTEITDAGLEHLKGLTKLHDLNLNFAPVSLQGCQKLHESLPDCTILCPGHILSPLSKPVSNPVGPVDRSDRAQPFLAPTRPFHPR